MPSAEYMREYRAGKKPGTKPNLAQPEPEDEQDGPTTRGAGRPKKGKKAIEEAFLAQGIENPRVLRALSHVILELAPDPQPMLLYHLGLGSVENTPIDGELVTEKELRALMYYSFLQKKDLVHPPDWKAFESTYFQALVDRRRCKTDVIFLGALLGKDFEHDCHRRWAEFLPKFNPDGLLPAYTEGDVKAWLARQKSPTKPENKLFLLMASRNAYKSSFSLVWALTGTLCCPDLRFMLCSETKDLSKDFVEVYRFYWTWGSEGCQKFHQLFPEYCLPPGDGSVLEFDSPVAHLGRAQKSAQPTSMESASAGKRFDIGLFDDPVSDRNTGTDDMREKDVKIFDAFMKLRETTGFAVVIGTPWHPADLYAEILTRHAAANNWAIRLDPAWTVKPAACFKTLRELTEQDVTLLFPERLTWQYLIGELGTTPRQERFFRSQHLIEWLPEENSALKLNFEMQILTRALMPMAIVPRDGDTIIAVDTAHTVSNRADLSALSVLRLFKNEQGAKSVVVLEQRGDRFHRAELAYELALLFKKWSPRLAIIEKPPYQEELELQIRIQSQRYGIVMPIIWAEVDNTKNAKIQRIKSLEGLLPDRLRFAMGNWNDALFNQLENLSGVSRSTQKDDLADSIGLGVRFFRFPLFTDGPKEEAANQAAAEAAKKQADLQATQQRLFGSASPIGQLASTLEPYDQPAESATPIQDALKRTLGSVYHA